MSRKERKAQTHEAIVDSASEVIRREGIEAATVAKVMEAAGLTVGGFYAHFGSKEALAASGLRRAFEQNQEKLFEGLEEADPEVAYDAIVRRYLSRQHRDFEVAGCPVPACLSEIDSNDTLLSDALIEGIESVATRIEDLFVDLPGLTARQRALATMAAFIGAMALARATRGTSWSDRVLLATRKLLGQLEGGLR